MLKNKDGNTSQEHQDAKAAETQNKEDYEKPTVAQLDLEDITFVVAASKSGMGMCKHTFL